jgi:AcrR family transcriptional regulator
MIRRLDRIRINCRIDYSRLVGHMARRMTPTISPRKQPRQVRSTRLVADILDAANRVLLRDGARRFTTARVAATAGISVGSLYQYFPNKEAILFRLQKQEWGETLLELRRILGNASVAPFERLRAAVRMFFRSECDEAAFRSALEGATSLYLEASEARAIMEEGKVGRDLGLLLRTLHQCDTLTIPAFRREAQRLLNHNERTHTLQRQIRRAGSTSRRGRRAAELFAQSGALALVTNLVMGWNAHAMQATLNRWHADHGKKIDRGTLRHITPMGFEQFNFNGVLLFPLDRFRSRLLPSSNPPAQLAAA